MEAENFTSDESRNDSEAVRYQVLRKLYEISDGDSRIPRQIEEVETALG